MATALLYDADCGLCRWSLGRILAWDRRRALRPVAIGSAEGVALLPGLSEAERMDSWHLVTEDGARASAGAAVPALLRMLPGGGPLAALTARWPRATEAVYRWIVRHRGTAGRLVTAGAARRARRRIAERSSLRNPIG